MQEREKDRERGKKFKIEKSSINFTASNENNVLGKKYHDVSTDVTMSTDLKAKEIHG